MDSPPADSQRPDAPSHKEVIRAGRKEEQRLIRAAERAEGRLQKALRGRDRAAERLAKLEERLERARERLTRRQTKVDEATTAVVAAHAARAAGPARDGDGAIVEPTPVASSPDGAAQLTNEATTSVSPAAPVSPVEAANGDGAAPLGAESSEATGPPAPWLERSRSAPTSEPDPEAAP